MEIFSVAGIIGLTLVATAVFGYLWMIIRGEPVNAPDWLVMLVTLVVKHFYDKASKNGDGK